jgi:hypothetical protein
MMALALTLGDLFKWSTAVTRVAAVRALGQR